MENLIFGFFILNLFDGFLVLFGNFDCSLAMDWLIFCRGLCFVIVGQDLGFMFTPIKYYVLLHANVDV